MKRKLNVVIWNEFRHEKKYDHVKAIYPNGMHATIKEFLEKQDDIEVTLAALDDPDQGISDELLEKTDVLLWWGHVAHKEVNDELVAKIQKRVYLGKMGFIALHSAHHSKPFKAIVGTSGNLTWGSNRKEIVWTLMPSHPIAAGIPEHFNLESEEIYAEPFYIPQPDALVFGGWFESGHIFRSGACFIRGAGKVFYFQPGHEECPSFHNEYVQKIITNAVYWAAPADFGFEIPDGCPHCKSDAFPADEFENK